jgi:F0F1-type ATP synthase membrane subunit a
LWTGGLDDGAGSEDSFRSTWNLKLHWFAEHQHTINAVIFLIWLAVHFIVLILSATNRMEKVIPRSWQKVIEMHRQLESGDFGSQHNGVSDDTYHPWDPVGASLTKSLRIDRKQGLGRTLSTT